LHLDIGAWIQKKNDNDGLPGRGRSFYDIFNHLDAINERDGQTDGRTDRHRPAAKTALSHSFAR